MGERRHPCGDQSVGRLHDETKRSPPPDGDVVCFTSPRMFGHGRAPEPRRIVALGTTTSEALNERGWAHHVAEHPDAFGVWEAMQER